MSIFDIGVGILAFIGAAAVAGGVLAYHSYLDWTHGR